MLLGCKGIGGRQLLGLPKRTEIRKPIPKKVLYNKFSNELTGERRKRFDEDVSRIVITNEISPVSVNIEEGEIVKSFFVVTVSVKNFEVDERNLILLSKLFGQHMVLVLETEEQQRITIYQSRILQTDWMKKDSFTLSLNGLNLDKVWEDIISQVSGIIVQKGNTLEKQIDIEVEKEKIKKQIEQLEKKARKEIQPKVKFEMFQRIKAYKKKLEEL